MEKLILNPLKGGGKYGFSFYFNNYNFYINIFKNKNRNKKLKNIIKHAKTFNY